MLYRGHHQSDHSAGTLIPCSHLTISAFAENAEMVENNIDVGNVPIKFHLCLCVEYERANLFVTVIDCWSANRFSDHRLTVTLDGFSISSSPNVRLCEVIGLIFKPIVSVTNPISK